MALGSPISVQGPMGIFTLHEDTSKPAVYLIGGIGITPARSMILQATQDHLSHSFYLFYSNRRPEDAAFMTEFQQLEKENPKFKLIATMTDMSKSNQPWLGETSYITRAMMENHIPDIKSAIYYLCGPPPFITAMQKMLKEMEVDRKSVKVDAFTGY